MRETLYSTLSLIKYLLEYVKKMLYKQYNRFVCISDCSLQLSSRSSAPEHQFVECMQIGPIRAAVEDASAPAREIPLTSFCSAEDRFDVQSIERSLWEPSEQNSHCCRSSSCFHCSRNSCFCWRWDSIVIGSGGDYHWEYIVYFKWCFPPYPTVFIFWHYNKTTWNQ